MFRSDLQRGVVCTVITARLPQHAAAPFWALDEHEQPRPTAELRAHLRRVYASSEAHLVRFAWTIWNGRGGFDLGRALDTLDGRNLRLVGSLLSAISAESGDYGLSIDAWIEKYWRPEALGTHGCFVPWRASRGEKFWPQKFPRMTRVATRAEKRAQ